MLTIETDLSIRSSVAGLFVITQMVLALVGAGERWELAVGKCFVDITSTASADGGMEATAIVLLQDMPGGCGNNLPSYSSISNP